MSDKKPEHGKQSDADAALDPKTKATGGNTDTGKKHDPWLKVDETKPD